MATGDLFNTLMTQLLSKEEQPAPDDNILIQKMIAPNETIQSNDTFATLKLIPSTFVWGGTGYTAGWLWNQGQWK